MNCSVCRTSGSNMVQCKKCNMVWCKKCAMQGKGHYPKQRASNTCPYCGTINSVIAAH